MVIFNTHTTFIGIDISMVIFNIHTTFIGIGISMVILNIHTIFISIDIGKLWANVPLLVSSRVFCAYPVTATRSGHLTS